MTVLDRSTLGMRTDRARLRLRILPILLTALCSFGWHPAQAAPEFEFTLIEAFEPDYDLREVMLRDLDESGAVIGTATHNGFYDGFAWTEATDKVIIPLFWPAGMNNLRQVVGDGTIRHLDTGATVTVPPAGIWPVTRLQAINDQGIAVGYSECACSNSDRSLQEALVWDGASRTIPVPNAKELLRINNQGVAVGNIRGGSAGTEGFLFDLRTQAYVNLTDRLPPYLYGRGRSELQDISETNTVTGRGWDGEALRGLVFSEAQGFTFLPAIPGGLVDRVYPRGINAQGAVVGFADLTLHVPHAFLWTPADGMRDLNDLVEAPPNFILDWAVRINDQGWIIGIGHEGPAWGSARGFVLRPLNQSPTDATDAARSDLRIAPNPARHDLTMRFALAEAGAARLSVFDVAGREVAHVWDGRLAAGLHALPWSATAALPAGVYYARLATPAGVRVERFVLLQGGR